MISIHQSSFITKHFNTYTTVFISGYIIIFLPCVCRIAKDPRFDKLPCLHSGTYADDCIVNRVMQHRCYIVATCDRDLKRRVRKVPGVPIMYITQHRYSIERMPDAFGGIYIYI